MRLLSHNGTPPPTVGTIAPRGIGESGLDLCDRTSTNAVQSRLPWYEANEAELRIAAFADHVPTSRLINNERSTLRTSPNAWTSRNVVDDDLFRNLQDIADIADPWVPPIAAFVSTALESAAFPWTLAGPAEIVVVPTRRHTARQTAKSDVSRVGRVTPGPTPGTLLAAVSLADVVLRHVLFDLLSGLVVEVGHVTDQKSLPDGSGTLCIVPLFSGLGHYA